MTQQLLRSAAFEMLSLGNAFPTTRTERSECLGLIGKLRPRRYERLIRFGPDGDGGYLIPDDLDGIVACFSPGVAAESGFERSCAERGMQVFLADGSVDSPAQENPRFTFLKKYIGAVCGEDFLTLDRWVEQSGLASDSDLLLQIDIEGFEYEALLAASESLMQRFRVIVGEFHELNQLWNRPYFSLVSRAFEKLLQTHVCVHIHPNNQFPPFSRWGLSIPPLAEFTFLRKDRMVDIGPETEFPHSLDFDNTNNPHYALPECWRGRV